MPWPAVLPADSGWQQAIGCLSSGCCSPRRRGEIVSRSEKTAEDGGNLPDDDAETQAFGLELTVEEVVGDRIRFKDARDDRPPSLQETLVGGMTGVEPMIKETLPLPGIGPEHPPIFEPSFVLVEQPSHGMDCRRERCSGQGSRRAVDTPLPPLTSTAVDGR